VRCLGCGSEKKFPSVNALVALELEEFLPVPTEVIAQSDGTLKKVLLSVSALRRVQPDDQSLLIVAWVTRRNSREVRVFQYST
jgi:hypothetical protein